MTLIHDIKNYTSNKPAILTIGTFDGVHLGHQKIIRSMVQLAKNKSAVANVLTFFPHPRIVLQKENSLMLIDTLDEKKIQLEKLGIDHLIVHPFTTDFSTLTAEEFVRQILVEKLRIETLFIGYDHRFGRNREATVEHLIAFGKVFNFNVNFIEAQEVEEVTVSSTKIRNAIEKGDFISVRHYLGRPFQFTATVIHGQEMGRKLNFPTANLGIADPHKIVPPNGVYLVQIWHKEKYHYGMMNVGKRPTLNGQTRTLEVHIFDFDKTIYGDSLTTFVYEKIRDEQKFDSLDALQKQLYNDRDLCNKILTEKGLN